jgi:hypothetical protein
VLIKCPGNGALVEAISGLTTLTKLKLQDMSGMQKESSAFFMLTTLVNLRSLTIWKYVCLFSLPISGSNTLLINDVWLIRIISVRRFTDRCLGAMFAVMLKLRRLNVSAHQWQTFRYSLLSIPSHMTSVVRYKGPYTKNVITIMTALEKLELLGLQDYARGADSGYDAMNAICALTDLTSLRTLVDLPVSHKARIPFLGLVLFRLQN